MMKTRRALGLLFLGLTVPALAALRVGPEVGVADGAGSQRNVVISRTQSRTLIAFEETAADGRQQAVLHQYEARLVVPRGRETFAVDGTTQNERRPGLGSNMIAWLQEDPAGASLWWQPLNGYSVGANFQPMGNAERVADVASGSTIDIVHTHVFHVLLWTAPDGRLKAAPRSLIARIGYDPSPFFVTNETAIHPQATESWNGEVLIAYNTPTGDPTRSAIRATALEGVWGRAVQPAVDLAPAGASAPRVVFNGVDFLVFWSMDDGGTFGQRMTATGGTPVKIGPAAEIREGILHDVAAAPNGEYLMVMERGTRFDLLRLDRDLNVLERVPFEADLVAGSKISISGNHAIGGMLAYAAAGTDGSPSRAVVRLVEEGTAPMRRRSVR